MRIFFMSDAPARFLEPLAVYFAHGRGDDVVFATGKHRQEAPLPDIRRIVMNFQVSVWHTGGSSVDFLWREALRNGNAGKKVMEGLAGSWRPDIILCRSSHGGAFFIRDVFPDAFMASFATLADCEAAARVVCRLDCLLFLESQLRFAPGGSACLPFPPLLRPQILPEPFYADTEFFTQEPGPPFSCWKFSDSQKPLIFFNLKGIREEDYSRWLGAVLETLRDSPDMLAVIAADKGRMMAKWLGALNRLEDFYQERIYLTDFLTREEQKSVYRTAIKAIIANPECRADILECASCGGNAACVPDPFLDGLDVTFRLRERDLAASIRTMPEKDARDTATNREKIVRYFSRKQPIRTLAERIVEAYRGWHQRKTAPGMRGAPSPRCMAPVAPRLSLGVPYHQSTG